MLTTIQNSLEFRGTSTREDNLTHIVFFIRLTGSVSMTAAIYAK
jgi:hypothetical protein